MKYKYNFSIIIPHKNTPELLKRCVSSIPRRDDVQIIIVDDNSDSGKKPDIKRDGVEIFLLNAENAKGAGRARNVGLQHAEGEWLLFADADDYFTDYLPTLLDKFVGDDHTDIVYLNACKFDENQVTKPFGTNKLIVNYLEGKKDADMHLKYDLWTPWSRMVRRSVVVDNAVAFDELPSANDKMFGLKCSFYAKSFKVEKEFVGRHGGFSFKVMKGVYYRTGQSRGKPIEHSYMDKVGIGQLIITNQNIIFYSQAKSVKIPFKKIVGLVPYSDGIEVQKDGATSKRMVFQGLDCWFIMNLLSQISI